MLAIFRTFLCTIILIALWGSAVIGFAVYADLYKLEDNAHADGIIVLTGGGGRIEYGLELLGKGRGKALFISGVNKDVPMSDLINNMPPAIRDILSTLPIDSVTLGHEATNTVGNAQESVDWVTHHGYKSILLVTADYHMPRAIVEFNAKMPANVVLIPAPVKTHDYTELDWLTDAATRDMVIIEFHKFVAAKIRQMIISYQNAHAS